MADRLELAGLSSGYGEAIVLRGIDLALAPGRSLAVLGRNGVGKTTLLNTVIGATRHRAGRVVLDGRDLTRLPPEKRARAGIGWVPQERNVFRSLTVEENLTAIARPGPWDVAAIYGLFPRLRERRRHYGNQLSGGEQQMLAIGRALVLNPGLLLLDEPTEGLAPIIVEEVLAALGRILAGGLSALVVEQHARQILGVTDDAVILERGSIVHRAASADLLRDTGTLERFLGVAGRA